jgi:hypothetical protein
MHDEHLVRVAHRIAHLQEQLQTFPQRAVTLLDKRIDRSSLHVFEHYVGKPVVGGAAVEDARDARGLEPA